MLSLNSRSSFGCDDGGGSKQNTRAIRPTADNIAVPPFPPGTEWIGDGPPAAERLAARGPLLVHFVDVAHHSSARTLPYLLAWHERYSDSGLTVLGVNSPRFPFTGEREKLAAALRRLGIPFPVALDSGYAIWRDYGCHGWPSLFLWGRGGALRWYHFGEGEYAATEEAIQGLLREEDALRSLPAPLAPVRPSDASGARVVPPSPEVFPAGDIATGWSAGEGDTRLELDYEGGSAYAALDGAGAIAVSVDGGPARSVQVTAPGSYELAEHERHEAHRIALEPGPGVVVHAVSFGAGVPA
jgi:hypothetical protein